MSRNEVSRAIAIFQAMENMEFTLSSMARLETSRSLAFGGGFALATGTDAASENWAFFPSPALEKTASPCRRVCAFFEGLALPFVWPLFPGTEARRPALEAEGLSARGELLVMTRSVSPPPSGPKNASLTFETVASEERAALWAETAWTGFGSPPGAPDPFVRLAQGLCGRGFLLILARRDGVPAGTAMLSLNGANAGLYYFATLPGERRKGVGDAAMEEAARLARERGCGSISLQATPSGAPFYASRGFAPLFGLPLYSRSADVF